MLLGLLAGRQIQPDWELPRGVRAVVSTRDGGVSDGAYASMNLSLTVGDDIGAVQENRIRFEASLPGQPRCAWLTQLHTSQLVAAHEALSRSTPAEADASWTDRPGIACVVLTADCVPLLLAADDGSKVAAVHAGWRGLASGIIQATASRMKNSGFSAFVGPAISQPNYEVSAQVRAELLAAGVAEDLFASSGRAGHALADLPGMAAALLEQSGARQVCMHGQCTFDAPQLFYSARRAGHGCGRMASAIWIDRSPG